MTAVIGFTHGDKAYIAGERANSDGVSIMNSLSKKVKKIGPYIYGYAGLTGQGQYIASSFSFPHPTKGMDIHEFLLSNFIPLLRKHIKYGGIDIEKEEDATEIILGYRNRIFEVSTYDYQCVEYDHTAIGSGREYCLGAYSILRTCYSDPIYIATRCIESAIEYSPTCSGQIDIVST